MLSLLRKPQNPRVPRTARLQILRKSQKRAGEYPSQPRVGVALCLDHRQQLLNRLRPSRRLETAVFKTLAHLRQRAKLFGGDCAQTVQNGAVEQLRTGDVRRYFGQQG